ncbi:hypothetical protein Dimus_004930 [Dionaea muscipula]
MVVEERVAAISTSCRALKQHIFTLLEKSSSVKNLTQIHTQILTNGFSQKSSILVRVISLYAAYGHLPHAQQVFEKIETPSTAVWNQIIRAHGRGETPRRSVELYARMLSECFEADGYTYLYAIIACSRSGMFREGEQIHGRFLLSGHCSNLFVGTSLVNFYSSAGGDRGLANAYKVFDEIPQRSIVAWNSLLAGCFRCGDVDGARRVFDDMPDRNLVSWTTMISGCAQHGRCVQALSLFREMRRVEVEMDQVVLISALSACAESGNLNLGKWIHSFLKSSLISRHDDDGDDVTTTLYNALIHMYASCGVLEEASEVFEDMPRRNSVSWTTMIMGYAKHGYGEEALRVFERMRLLLVEPDAVTFIGVLSACSHAGYVEKGRHYFKEMKSKWGIEPRIDHFGCMVDLLSRAGLLGEAYNLVKRMPMKPNDAIWGALIGGCRIHKNTELAFHAAQNLITLLQQSTGPEAMGYLVLMRDVYALAKRWEDVVRVSQKMNGSGKKPPGRSWLQINGVIHEFIAGDESHKHASSIYDILYNLMGQMKCHQRVLASSKELSTIF